jgi:SRSO17 transposase
VPVDFELYLPQSWTDDDIRRKKSRIPKETTFRTKPQLAMEMIDKSIDVVTPNVLPETGPEIPQETT